MLIRAGASFEEKSFTGKTPLELAVYMGNQEAVGKLIDHGALVSTDILDFALLHDSAPLIRRLISAGASFAGVFDRYNKTGRVIDILQLSQRNEEIIAAMLASDLQLPTAISNDLSWVRDPTIKLHLAALYDHALAAHSALTAGAVIDHSFSGRLTPLARAVASGSPEAAKLLIERGANTELLFDDGCTLIHLAAKNHSDDVLRMLIDAGVDPSAKNHLGETALFNASLNCIKCLLSRKPPLLMERSKNGNTSLHAYARTDCTDTVRLLLDNGADVNSRNGAGSTPLHLAAAYASILMVKVLIGEANATVDIQDNDGFTPTHRAASLNRRPIIDMLIGYGADLEVRNNLGMTVLDTIRKYDPKSPVLIEDDGTGEDLDCEDDPVPF